MAAPVFPDHWVNPKEKLSDPKWITQMVKAIWHEFNTQSIKSFNKGINRYNLNKLYSLGKQPSDIYKPIFEVTEDDNLSFMNLDFSPPAVLPKFRRIILAKFAKLLDEFSISADAVDPLALDDKNSYEANEMANIQTRRMLQELGIDSSQLDTGEIDQPMDEEELAIKMEFGWKHDDAIQIEKSIKAVFAHERLQDQASQMRDYGFYTGVLAMKTYTDEITGKVGFNVVDPSNLIVSPTKDIFFRDIWYAGEYKLISIDEIRRESQGDIDEEKLAEIADKNRGLNGNPQYWGPVGMGSQPYDNCKVPVLDVEFLSEDVTVYEKRKDKRGNVVRGKVDPKEKRRQDREYMEDKRVVVYRAKWIVGSESIYNWGLKSDMPVVDDSVWSTRLSYIMAAPEMNILETSPIIENLIPTVDQITIAWYKLQNIIARARPKGIAIEIGALEDISMGDGMESMRPIDILDMFTKTGNLVFRRINLEGAPANYKPIEELQNGMGTEAKEQFDIIAAHMGMLRDMIGFNDFTDASTPDPKALKGVGNMAVEATSNAIHHLLEAERNIIERVAEDIAIRVHDSIKYKKNSPYRTIITHNGLRSLNSYDGNRSRVYNMMITYGSDKMEKAKLEARIQQSMANKEITLADAVAIERITNTKQAELLLAYRIKKNMLAAQQRAQQDQMANAQASAMAAKAAEEEKRKTIEAQLQADLVKMQKEGEITAANLILEYTLRTGNEAPKLASKEKIAEINNAAKHTLETFKATQKSPAAA